MITNIRKKSDKELRLSAGLYIGFAILAILGMGLMVSQLAVLTYDILSSQMFPALRHLPAWCYFDQWPALYRFCGCIFLLPATFAVIYQTAYTLGLCERVIVVDRD
ncbi:hypothetical protein [Geomonas subterranea]|uniref:hypothetical protein n=1 Tax=Geomonas subterranea TaxID=2847989 RepID=UPI001CD44747|nr:hypothetical protein [Geomonas fuzhouensis]